MLKFWSEPPIAYSGDTTLISFSMASVVSKSCLSRAKPREGRRNKVKIGKNRDRFI